LARELGAEAPIVEAVYRALYGGCEPVEAVIGAMTKHTFFRTFE
jgi:glycerol-3-phosphate dehydrogenase